MDSDSQIVPFPLFHGTSSHYLAAFKPGASLADWPHKDVALSLFRDAWAALQALGCEPKKPWVRHALNQASGHSNWQHGELYVTPSKGTARMYADGGAIYGGELLTFCRCAVDRLAELDRERAESLMRDAESIAGFLKGAGSPILVEFVDVSVCSLSPERSSDNVLDTLSHLEALSRSGDECMREIIEQQTNFRLAPRGGTVGRVFEVESRDSNDPVSPFNLKPIHTAELWGSSPANPIARNTVPRSACE